MHDNLVRCNVRKLLRANTLLAVALPFLVVGCGGGPTAPTIKPAGQTDAVASAPVSPTPAPVPGPTPEPTPAPTPAPTPTPGPTPVPTPSPGPTWTFDGSTTQAHWYDVAVLPDRFQLEIVSGSVQAADHNFPILSQGRDNVYVVAGTRNVETLTLEYHGPTDGSGTWRWTYNGLPGQAAGTLSRRR